MRLSDTQGVSKMATKTWDCDGCGKPMPIPPDPYGTVSLMLCAKCNHGVPVAGGHSLPWVVSDSERQEIYKDQDRWAAECLRYDNREEG